MPIAAVTLVGVQPSHRRRGILTQMMRRQLDHAHERGEPVAALWATEGSIYPRFGYGLATTSVSIEADRDRMRFRAARRARRPRSARRRGGVAAAGAADLRGACRRTRPACSRATRAGGRSTGSPTPSTGARAAGRMFRAVWEDDDGEPQAYALYRSHGKWEEFIPAGDAAGRARRSARRRRRPARSGASSSAST